MATSLKMLALSKAAALFSLSSTLFLTSLPARASDQLADLDKTLSTIGTGVMEWVFILFVVIMICAFHDGKSRRSQENDLQRKDSQDKQPD
jgi:hypothetical protein